MRPTLLKGLGVFFLATLLLPGSSGDVRACAFDGPLGGNFSAMHARSIPVALAVRDAVEEGLVGKAALDLVVPGRAGYWRAVDHLNSVHRLLSDSAAGDSSLPTSMSLLFVDSGLWTRFTPGRQGIDIVLHTPDAAPGDVVIVTSEPVVVAILNEQLPVEVALKRGLIDVVERTAKDRQAGRWIAAALEQKRVKAFSAASSAPRSAFGAPRVR